MSVESMNFEEAKAAQQSALSSGQEAMKEFNAANTSVGESIASTGAGLGGNLGKVANANWMENSATNASNVSKDIDNFVDNALNEIMNAGKTYQNEAESIYKQNTPNG